MPKALFISPSQVYRFGLFLFTMTKDNENRIQHLKDKYSRATYELIKICDKDELQLYLWFKLWAIKKSTLFPSIKTIADDLEVSKRTIIRLIERMEEKNRLRVERREGKSNIYDITWYDELVARTSQGSDKNVSGSSDKSVTLTNNNKTKRKNNTNSYELNEKTIKQMCQ